MSKPTGAAAAFIEAARCPPTIATGTFGLWTIERRVLDLPTLRCIVGADHHTVLHRMTAATMHLPVGEIVMEDSTRELARHLPIWLAARGRVLITGLGLGCVVRALLTKPDVESVTVVEIDPHIIRAVWPEFGQNLRAILRQGDAITMDWPPGTRWDWAWHDIWGEDRDVALLHADLFNRYANMADQQGAWGMPKWFHRRVGGTFLSLSNQENHDAR